MADATRPYVPPEESLAELTLKALVLGVVVAAGRIFLPAELSGISPAAYESTTRAAGQGVHPVPSEYIQTSGEWQVVPVSAGQSGGLEDIAYLVSAEAGAQLDFAFNGQEVVLFYSTGPDHGIWDVLIDGQPLVDGETGEPMTIDAYHPTLRYEVEETFRVDASGEHSLMIINSGQSNPESQGTLIAISAVEVLPPQRQSSLLLVIGLILVVELVGLTLSYFLGPLLFSGLAGKFNTKNSILLALSVRDGGQANGPGWRLRVVPNKFPALQIKGELNKQGEGMFDKMNGIGAHEVFIENPDHNATLATLPGKAVEEVLFSFRDRMEDLKKDRRFQYALIFKNEGITAAATLEQSHSQLIALPIVPIQVQEELDGCRRHYDLKERCIFCDIIRQELQTRSRSRGRDPALRRPRALCPPVPL